MRPEKGEFLTPLEHEAMRHSAELANLFGAIIGDGPTRTSDLTEALQHIHALQNMILAQAAATAYPKQYRAMGEVVGDRVMPWVS